MHEWANSISREGLMFQASAGGTRRTARPRMRRLSGMDVMMLFSERGPNYNHTFKISILDPSDDPEGWSFERFRAWMEWTVGTVPMLRTRCVPTPLGLHQPVWVEDPHFNLDAHLRRVVCPAPGGMRELCTLAEQIYNHTLDRHRPLWEMWVVEGLSDGCVGLVALLHHAYTDGLGALAIFSSLVSDCPGDIPPAPSRPAPRPLPSTPRLIAAALRDLVPTLRILGRGVRAIRRRIAVERAFAATHELRPPHPFDKSIPQPFAGPLTNVRRFACRSFPLDALREIRAQFGGTINDVFLACCAGTIRRQLEREGVTLDRPTIGAMALATKGLEERSGVGGNHTSFDYVWLHAEVEDPVERLARTKASAQATKDHFAQIRDIDPMELLDAVPGRVMSALAAFTERTEGRYSAFRNVGVSNVPGAREPRYFGRWRVKHWFSTGQLAPGLTVNLTVWSYVDQFNLCALTDASRVDDAWGLIDGFGAALDELVAAARTARKRSATEVA